MPKIFISYNRESEAIVKTLADDLDALGHTVWLDQELSGGQSWWDHILSNIRQCDIFIFALSNETLNSVACKREYLYGFDLGKPILPVRVGEGVSTNLLPPALSKLQLVDYRQKDRDAAIRLARALGSIPPPAPLPEPLPVPPEVPISYLGSLTEKIGTTSTLSYEEQSILIVDLKRGLRDSETAEDAYTLLERLRKRRDLLASIAEDIDELVESRKKQSWVPPNVSEPQQSLKSSTGPDQKQKVLGIRKSGWQTILTVDSSPFNFRESLKASIFMGFVGAIIVGAVALMDGGSSARRDWLLIGTLWGGIPWGVAGAIAGLNRRVIITTLHIGAIGVIGGWLIAGIFTSRETLLMGAIFGGSSVVILRAILGVILKKRNGW